MGIKLRGQGATEYLVLLGAVLIVALVALALLGFFPGLSTDAKVQQSQAYWTGEAKPFAITEYGISAGGNATLIIQNKEATGAYTLNTVQVGQAVATVNEQVGPGDTIRISLDNGNLSGTQARAYEYQVTFTYTSPGNISGTQVGAKTLMGKYN